MNSISDKMDLKKHSSETGSKNNLCETGSKNHLREMDFKSVTQSSGVDLRNYSDDKLIFETEKLVRSERELLTQILNHLREIERRRLFSKHKCSSLFDYAVKKLGYSEDQAGRRISAMRFLKDLPESAKPEVEKKISSGALSLTHLSLAHSFVRKEKVVSEELKLKLLSQIENKPTREAERIVISHAEEPGLYFKDKIRPVSKELSEIKFHADDELLKKIEKLKGLLAHKHPNISIAELFHKLCDLGIEKFDPGLKLETEKTPVSKRTARNSTSERTEKESASGLIEKKFVSIPTERKLAPIATEKKALFQDRVEAQAFKNQDSSTQISSTRNFETQRYGAQSSTQLLKSPAAPRVGSAQKPKLQPNSVQLQFVKPATIHASKPTATPQPSLSQAATRREVWRRAKSCCENCQSTYALQIDHITPKALGGRDTIENFRLLCRTCNQRAAITQLGIKKMQRHLEA